MYDMLTVQFYRCLLPEHTVSWMEPCMLMLLRFHLSCQMVSQV